MYVEKTDTYTCDFCGHNAKWDASDDVHGELWSCEAEGCGKVFCSKCFISAFGQEIYMTMMQSGENVLCPECAKKKYIYDDWNGTAAYNSTFNPNFKKGE